MTQANTAARILLVDDDTDCLNALSRLLAMSGYTVQIADRAQSAKEMCRLHTFDVMITDIGLPDQTGYELMREITQRYQIPGIALSGYGAAEDVEESRNAGFHLHMVKPFQSGKLIEAIRTVLSTRIIPVHRSTE